MNSDETTEAVIEEDYYARLNIPREATQEEIISAYRRWSRFYHPDKHIDAEQKKKAELLFSRIKQAYEVLNDPHQRAIYDTVGIKGLKTDGWEIVQRTKTPLEIREEYERLAREKNERRLHQRTNPKGAVVVNINATDLFTPYEDAAMYDYMDKSFFPSIEISGLSISQSIEAPLTRRNTLTLGGGLSTQNGTGSGTFFVSCKRLLPSNSWIEGEFAAGNGPVVHLRYFRSLTQTIFSDFGLQFKHTPNGIRWGLVTNVGMPLDRHTQGYMTWHVGLSPAITTMVVRDTDKSHTGVVFSLGISSSFVSMNHTWKINKVDLKLRIYCKVGTINSLVECSAEKKVSEQSSLSAAVSVGLQSGVTLKIKIVRAHQSYSFPIHLSEEPQLIPSVYAVVTPFVVWFAVKKLVVEPFMKEQKEKQIERTREINRNKWDRPSILNISGLDKIIPRYHAQTLMEEKKREARAAVDLMQASYQRIRTEEEARNGLIILKAIYGKNADTVTKLENPALSQLYEIIDVTVPLQCLVKNSQLALHNISKSQLSGFYDPCVGEDKVLFVQYLFHSHLCETTVNDNEALRIPKQGHRVNVT